MQGDGQKRRLEEAEGLDGCQVGWQLHYDAVALVQKCLAQEIEALLLGIGDHDLCRVDLQPRSGIPPGDHLSQRKVALGDAVQEDNLAALGQNPLGGCGYLLNRKVSGVGWQQAK